MDINPAASAAVAAIAPTGTSVLKQAIDAQAQSARILIDSIAQTPNVKAANLPPNLGQNINTTA
jgi:siroheme synthase (precorrin-2 oxidase/ferrochelatase)